MPRSLDVHLLPALVDPAEMAGGTVVVIDVLRASTTIVQALASGAECVVACLEVEQARATAAELPTESVRLGGERHCLRIEGFDFGNSPADYTPEAVGGKTVVFTTTNGTRALLAAREAARVLVAAFINCSATAEAMRDADHVHLLCAGTEGNISREDVLFAGCLAERLIEQDHSIDWEWNDSAELALSAWREADRANLAAELRNSRGGRNLVRNQLESDLARAAAIDALPLVAHFDAREGRITSP